MRGWLEGQRDYAVRMVTADGQASVTVHVAAPTVAHAVAEAEACHPAFEAVHAREAWGRSRPTRRSARG